MADINAVAIPSESISANASNNATPKPDTDIAPRATAADDGPRPSTDPTAALPFDPTITVGSLDNGLRYYIRPNPRPKRRLELRVVVRAGSVLEDEAERGLAHMTEHLAFRHSRAHKNHALIRHLESMGMKFGAHQNAYTTFHETVYSLHVPTNDAYDGDGDGDGDGEAQAGAGAGGGGGIAPGSVLAKSVELLGEMCLSMVITDEDVEKERSIIVEEWRQSLGAAQRQSEAHFKASCAGSKYAERLPMGSLDVVRGAPPSRVRGFYKKYYHPSRMAVVAVGDVPAARLEALRALIARVFGGDGGGDDGGTRAPPAPLPGPVPVPSPDTARAHAFTDPEVTQSYAVVECRATDNGGKPSPLRTVGDYRASLVKSLFVNIMNTRLSKLAMQKDPPFLGAAIGTGASLSTVEQATVSVRGVDPSGDGRGGGQRDTFSALAAATCEVERARAHGVTQQELDRAKADWVAELRLQYAERDQVESSSWAQDIVEYYLGDRDFGGDAGARNEAANGSVPTPIAFETRLAEALLPTVTREQVSAVPDKLFPSAAAGADGGGAWDAGTFVSVTEPQTGGPLAGALDSLRRRLGFEGRPAALKRRALAALRGARAAAASGELGPWEQPVLPTDWLPEPGDGAGGRVVSERRMHVALADGDVGVKAGLSLDGDMDEFVLSNGMTVCVKATHFLDDDVQFDAFAWGGLSDLSDELRISGRMAGTLAAELGQFGVRPQEYADLMAGKRVTLTPSIHAYRRTFGGDCSPADLGTCMQLIHALFATTVRPDAAQLRTVLEFAREQVRLGQNNPHIRFQQRVQELNSQAHPYMRPATIEDVDAIDSAFACDFFSKAFRNPAEFTVVFVGNVDRDAFKALAERYLASIPVPPADGGGGGLAKPRTKHSVPGLGVAFPAAGPTREHVRMPLVENSCVQQITFPVTLGADTDDAPAEGKGKAVAVAGTAGEDGDGGDGGEADDPGNTCASTRRLDDLLRLTFMSELLQTRLTDTLRFNLGGIYTVHVSPSFAWVKPGDVDGPMDGTCAVSFTCAPKDAEEYSRRVLEEIGRMRECAPVLDDGGDAADAKGGEVNPTGGGVTARDVRSMVEVSRRDFETALRTNEPVRNFAEHFFILSALHCKGNLAWVLIPAECSAISCRFWLDNLAAGYQSPRFRGHLANTVAQAERRRRALLDGATPAGMKKAFQDFLPPDRVARRTQVILSTSTSFGALRRRWLWLGAAALGVGAVGAAVWAYRGRGGGADKGRNGGGGGAAAAAGGAKNSSSSSSHCGCAKSQK